MILARAWAARDDPSLRVPPDQKRKHARELHAEKDRICQKYGMSGAFYAKSVTIINRAEGDPDRYGDLVEMLDAGVPLPELDREMKRRKVAPRGQNDPNTRMQSIVDTIEQAVDALVDVPLDQLDPGLLTQWRRSLKHARTVLHPFVMEPKTRRQREGDAADGQ